MDIVNAIKDIKDTERKIREIDETNKKPRFNQSGGLGIFVLISSIGNLFVTIISGFIGLFPKLLKLLLKPSVKRATKEESEVIKNPLLRFFARIPKPYTKSGEGYLWKYLWFCLKTSFYLVMFALGGIIITIFGLVYIYRKLYKDYTKIEPYEVSGISSNT